MQVSVVGIDTKVFSKAFARMFDASIREGEGNQRNTLQIMEEIAPAVVALSPYNEGIKRLEEAFSTEVVAAAKAKLGIV